MIFFKMFSCMGFRGSLRIVVAVIYIVQSFMSLVGGGRGQRFLQGFLGVFWSLECSLWCRVLGSLGYNIHVLLLAASGDLSTHGHEDQALLGGCMLLRLHHQWLAFRAR